MNRYHQSKLTRRKLLRSAAVGVTALTSARSLRVWGNGLDPYAGKLLVTLQLDGGADVTQLCDPKVNTLGEPKINNWADQNDPGEAGNLLYAPIADNANFFRRFGADTLVLNGVDAQTNSHETGKLYNWTGSNAEGRPSITALHAAAMTPNQPLAYAVYGGASRTAGLITYNRFDDVSRLRELSDPHRDPRNPDRLLRAQTEIDFARMTTQNTIAELLSNPNVTPRQRKNLSNLKAARDGQEGLARLADSLPSEEEMERDEGFQVGNFNFWSNLKQQMQGALLVMKSGLGSAADLSLGGFDSHELHDPIHDALYTHLADALYFFWDYAEELGLADRILLVVGSDFGRTNMYNAGEGKDHWNIGSYMIMEQNARWGNRVVGATDEIHFARKIDPSTLQVSDNGVTMTPAHIHKAVRKYMGLDVFADSVGMGLDDVEDVPIFNPNKMTRV